MRVCLLHRVSWRSLLSQGVEHNVTIHQWKTGICPAGVLNTGSVNLICAEGPIFTTRGSAIFFPYYHFSCHSSWSRVSVGCNFYATESKLAVAYLPQSCTRSWPAKVKPHICPKLVLDRLQDSHLCLKDLVSVHLGIFYTVFRGCFFFLSFSSGVSGSKQCSQSSYTYMKCKFEH